MTPPVENHWYGPSPKVLYYEHRGEGEVDISPHTTALQKVTETVFNKSLTLVSCKATLFTWHVWFLKVLQSLAEMLEVKLQLYLHVHGNITFKSMWFWNAELHHCKKPPSIKAVNYK